MLSSCPVRAGEILKRGGFGARERDTQRPLKSPSFGTFLGEARKVHSPPPLTKKHPFSPKRPGGAAYVRVVSFFFSRSMASVTASGMGIPIRPAFSTMDSSSFAM